MGEKSTHDWRTTALASAVGVAVLMGYPGAPADPPKTTRMTDVEIVTRAVTAASRGGAGLAEADRRRAEQLARLLVVAGNNADALPQTAEFKADGTLAVLTR